MKTKKVYPIYLELSETDYRRLLKLMDIFGERTKVGVIRYLLRKELEKVGDSDGATVSTTQKLD